MNTVPYLDLKAQDQGIREEVLAAYCGVKYCVSLNNGTSALHLALRCLDIGPGDEVITVPFTFIATAGSLNSVVGQRHHTS